MFELPAEFDISGMEIRYLLVGSDMTRSVRSFLRSRPGVRHYVLETLLADGSPATALRAYIYRPGFGFAFVAADLTTGPLSRTITLTPRPLKFIDLRGRVVLSDGGASRAPRIVALYWPVDCAYFGPMMDCALGPLGPVASTSLAEDGSFTLPVPDFGGDPALARFADKGELSFRIVAPSGADVLILHDRLKVAERYNPVVLDPSAPTFSHGTPLEIIHEVIPELKQSGP